jgi:hypothetical protein
MVPQIIGGKVASESRSRGSSRKENAEHDEVAQPEATERQEHAKETSEVTDELLDHIDDVLRESIGLDADATDEEYEKRSDEWMRAYVQKGGQ